MLLWRYLVTSYLKVLFLSLASLVAVLLTTRLDDIAHFACLGGTSWQLCQFAFLQLPYLLPIALPLAALLAAWLTMRRLSHQQELTALRASGLSLRAILAPILAGAMVLSLLNFYLISEIAPAAHLASGLLRHELRSINPLLLLSNKRLLQLQGIYGEAWGAVRHGEAADDVVMAFPASSRERQRLVVAKNLQANSTDLIGEQVTFIGARATAADSFDQLLVENVDHLEMPLTDFIPFLRQRVWSLHPDHLRFPLLLAAIEEERSLLVGQPVSTSPPKSHRRLHAAYTEISRRLSLALAVFTLTLLGAASGIQLGRQQRRLPLIFFSLATALYLVAYFLAKSLEDHWTTATLLLFASHGIIVALAIYQLTRIDRGVE